MKTTEKTVEVITTKHDSAFIADAKRKANIEERMSAHVAGIAEEMEIAKDADEPELKPLRAHLRSLLERAGYAESVVPVYASRLVREFTGKEKGAPRKHTFAKPARETGKAIVADIRAKFPEAEVGELVEALKFAIRELSK